MKLSRSRILWSLAILLIVAGGVAASSGAIRTRLVVLGLKLTGQVPDVPLSDFPMLMRPHSGFDIEALLQTRSGAATFVLPNAIASDTMPGSRLFANHCSQCHGAGGEGKIGPSLISGGLRHGATDWALYRVIRAGIPQTAMRSSGLGFNEAWRVIALLRARQLAQGTNVTTTGTVRARPVDERDLVLGDAQETEWLSWSGGWSGRRHRQAPALTEQSLDRMRLAWAYQLPADPAISQSTPIAVGRLLIATTAEDVIALDQATGDVVWRFHHPLGNSLSVCCQRANRGAAVYGKKVYIGTLDARLLALDLQTGRQVWRTQVSGPAEGVSLTGAPLVADGKVIVGMAGGEFGVRGFLDAYDAETGQRVWRFYTIPVAGEPGSETWPAEAMKRGGGATWVTGAYDPSNHLLYWGTGNPAPAMAPDVRPGDNLYSCSVIALDIRTGRLRWTYQFTPNDSHDWDSAQTPLLVDMTWKGSPRRVILWINRNGFSYALDRESGEFLRGSPFVRQTWNHGFDSAGRPRVAYSSLPTPGGTLVYPGGAAAANWFPASYSPELNLVFVSTRELGAVFVRGPSLDNFTGYTGGVYRSLEGERVFMAVEPESGKIRWRSSPPNSRQNAAMTGTLSLGDRLVLAGAGSQLLALDARTGRAVWQQSLGAPINTAPVLFEVEGRPHITVTAGSVLFVFGWDARHRPTASGDSVVRSSAGGAAPTQSPAHQR